MIPEHALRYATERLFSHIKAGQKFATVANNAVVIWSKVYDGDPVYKSGDTDDGYTCPIPNVISDCGFSAVFYDETTVCPVETRRYVPDDCLTNLPRYSKE